MIFRDHFLSDQVGFVYSRWAPEDAAANFLDRIRDNTRPMLERGADVLVPIILDGENAWEYYDHNGRPFLRELYRRISESSDLAALTVSEALALDSPQPSTTSIPGSWINANFDIWIGAEEDNMAWEYLLAARRKFDEVAPTVTGAQRTLAYEELLDRRRQRLVLVVRTRAHFRKPHRVRRIVPAASCQRVSRAGDRGRPRSCRTRF